MKNKNKQNIIMKVVISLVILSTLTLTSCLLRDVQAETPQTNSTIIVNGQTIIMNVDTLVKFQYDTSLTFSEAYATDKIEILGSSYYNRDIIINLKDSIIFDGNYCKIIGLEPSETFSEVSFPEKLIYQTDKGSVHKIFPSFSMDGRELLFFINPPKDGLGQGSFTYTTSVTFIGD